MAGNMGGKREGAGRPADHELGRKVQLSVHVPGELRRALSTVASFRDQSVSALVTEILAAWREELASPIKRENVRPD